MRKSIFLMLFMLLALHAVLGSRAAAQGTSACPVRYFSCGQYSLLDAACYPPVPLGAYNCDSYLFETNCLLTPLCPPPPSPPCGCSGSGGNSGGSNGGGGNVTAGFPINLAGGDTYIEENDIHLPGLGGGLTLTRQWNSLWPSPASAYQVGIFGPNWRSTYEDRVFLGSDNYVKYLRSDGSIWSLTYNNGVYPVVGPANISATLIPGTSYWTLQFQDGSQRLFDNNTGKLIAVIDRNGNTTNLTYDGSGRLTTVTDPVSRHLYLSYGTGSGLLVTSITTDFGVSTSYSYDDTGRLTQVTEPDGSTLSFEYDSNSFISEVLDEDGKIMEAHTYDSSGRGLTSSRANGVEAVTVSY